MRLWMRLGTLILGSLFLLPCGLMAQPSPALFAMIQSLQIELGKWWKNSEIVSQLQLSDGQVTQIERAFLEHRPMLATLNADLKRQEADLQKLMQEDPIDEVAIRARTESVVAARAALETENSSMMLAIRKVLSREQWEMLEKMRNAEIYTVEADGVIAPMAIRQPLPQYTQEARDAKVEGIITLLVIIRKDGTVTPLKIVKGLGYGLDESALSKIANEWRFKPGTKDGKPVDVQATIEVSFRLY